MTVICFGDSNTFGFDPHSYIGGRYAPEARWVDILAELTGWEVRNNGMNGREIPRIATSFSKSADFLIIMLGTNDILQGNTSDIAACRMEHYLDQLTVHRNKVLLIAPPAIQRGEWIQDQSVVDESLTLADKFREVSRKAGVHFADANAWNIPLSFDGVHFTEAGNKHFADSLVTYFRTQDLFAI